MELMPAVFCLAKDYGVKGVFTYARLKMGLTEGISLPNIEYPIHLRRNTSDIPAFQAIFAHKEYEVELGFIPRTIIDVGANIGLASVYFANRYKEARIISIEPEQSNFDCLQRNIKMYKRIKACKNALSNQSKQILNILDNGHGNWGFMTAAMDASDGKAIEGLVETISVEDIMKQNGIEYIDILKIDIEGAEKTVFENNYEYWLPRTRCLMIELHDRLNPGCSHIVFNALGKYDFSYFQNGENLVFLNMNKDIQSTLADSHTV